MPVPGLWNIGKFNLPDWGISERLGIGPNNAGVYQNPGQSLQAQAPYGFSPTIQQQRQVLGSTSPTPNSLPAPQYSPGPTSNVPSYSSGGGGITGGNVGQPDYSNINQGRSELEGLLEQEYNSAMGMFGEQENLLRNQAQTSEASVGSEFESIKGQLGQEQQVKQEGAEATLSTAEKTGTNAMRQARDLFREQQQSNIAQLSGLGISSSSVSEALSERLGVETARRIAGITGSLDEVRLNTKKEIARINNFYQTQLTNLSREKENRMSEVRNSLQEGLLKIAQGRNEAASSKARQRTEIAQDARAAIDRLNQQFQQFQLSAQKWAASKASALQSIIDDPNYLNSVTNTANTMNQNWAPQGFAYAPNFNAKGQVTGYRLVSTKDKEDENDGGDL